jgi:hypothetical protein
MESRGICRNWPASCSQTGLISERPETEVTVCTGHMGDAFSLGKPGEEASMPWKECSVMNKRLSIWSRRPCNRSTTRSARGCHPCLRYVPSPMYPDRTKMLVAGYAG